MTFLYKPTGNKKGLIIGITYHEDDRQVTLEASIPSALRIKEFVKGYGFEEDSLTLLLDKKGYKQPTRENILDEIHLLVKGALPNDSLFFYFAGHGTFKDDEEYDEWDSQDEGIDPCDASKNGSIVDDLLYERLIDNLPSGCRLTAIFDCCHSGTMLDLAYEYNEKGARIKPEPAFKFPYKPSFFNKPPVTEEYKRFKENMELKQNSPKNVVLFSA